MTVNGAAVFLKRGTRRVYQLLESGELEDGDFQGSILTTSVVRYKRKLDTGAVRRGRPSIKAALKNGKKAKREGEAPKREKR